MKKNMKCPVCGKKRKRAHDVNFKIVLKQDLDATGRCVRSYYVCNDIWLENKVNK